MKALILEENQRLVYKELPQPTRPGPDYVLVKVAAAGICASDLHRAYGGGAYHYPLIMGHEFAGVVQEGANGSDLQPGQRVTVFPLIPCRHCLPCHTGDFAQCLNYDYLGSRRNGAFAEFVYAPAENCFPLPEHVNLQHAALTEPAAVALHGVNKLDLKSGGTGVVYGGGPVGNLVAQWLRLRGCRRVMVVDIEARKLEPAKGIGLEPVNAERSDPVEAVRNETGGGVPTTW